ncbi:zinc ion binding [Pyrenophora seminiperda CCB06]|uniref:Zinc ion binding n=1 Tax=Pyrenophora seminiperda CCB06 TaxID=1302712 RepID=A0A3M7MI43_9PLEO|nr:zinc ion binding [Pyrenophora seminiperda CCB06]
MYVDWNCDSRDGGENFFIGGFQSLGEAVYVVKLAVRSALPRFHRVSLFDKTIELLGGKEQVQQRYTIEKGRRGEKGKFVREADWTMGHDIVTVAQHLHTGLRRPVLRLFTPEQSKKPIPQLAAQPISPQAKHRVQAPTAATTPTPVPSPPGQQAPAQQRESDPNHHHHQEVYCICRLPDDGSLMVACGSAMCPIEWYHGRCVNVEKPDVVDKQWYCELCVREQQNNKKKCKLG